HAQLFIHGRKYIMTILKSIIAFSIGVLLLSGCKKDDNPTNPPGGGTTTYTTYAGTFAGSSESGSMSVTRTTHSPEALPKTAAIDSITGTLKISGGATIILKGTLNTADGSFTVSGGGYTFTGTLSGTSISGSYTGPNGPGSFTMKASSNNSVKVFVGTFTSQAGRSNGRFNLAWDSTGATLNGLAVSDSGSNTQLTGIVVVDSIKIYIPGYTDVFLALGKFTNAADTAAAGVYNNYSDDHGIWSCARAH
ncbi:MAG TPA: hypothetical protein VES59_07585, partial [Bacteroidota bacterium]|nr:hypothetical protein [Bacteroidota bacterium]